jgi:hypothetical protein
LSRALAQAPVEAGHESEDLEAARNALIDLDRRLDPFDELINTELVRTETDGNEDLHSGQKGSQVWDEHLRRSLQRVRSRAATRFRENDLIRLRKSQAFAQQPNEFSRQDLLLQDSHELAFVQP